MATDRGDGTALPEAGLRLVVHRLRRAERRRIFPPAVHVGPLDRPVSVAIDPGGRGRPDVYDDGLRCDLARRLLEHAEPEGCGGWLTRVGRPEPHDLDALWASALARAFLEAGLEPAFLVVVTKQGWYEPRGDRRRTWQRLRIR
jgi:hypothetical protein